MNKPAFSIIILSALRRICTQRCVDSIDRFTNIRHEIVVVDMGRDKTIEEWLRGESKKRNNFKIVLNENNVGTSRGRNQGLRLAEGEYVVFLDNDAMVTEGWIDGLLGAAKRWPEGALFGAKIVSPNGYIYFCDKYMHDYIDNGVRKVGLEIIKPFLKNDPGVNTEREVDWYPTTCLMARQDILKEVSGFDEALRFAEEDKDLSYRIKEKGRKIIYCPSSCVIHNRAKDDLYDKAIRYNNIPGIKRDIRYFESHWSCKVELIYSKECLELAGYSEAMIDNIQKGELSSLFTVV